MACFEIIKAIVGAIPSLTMGDGLFRRVAEKAGINPDTGEPTGKRKDPDQRLALGGIIDRPTLALMGEGTESEHVIPRSMLQAALNSVAGAAGGGGRTILMIDKRVLGEVVDELMGGRMPAGMAQVAG